MSLEAREALYGGAAGGGKSDALLMDALQYVDVPGYAALLLRKTFADLAKPGALMDRAHSWLQGTAARWVAQEKKWIFPSGATVSFGYLEQSNDHYQYQGSEYQYCIAKGTPILMADGTHRSVQDVRVGDAVETLVGPRRVTRTHTPKVKPCYSLRVDGVETIVSEDHRILTEAGWVSPKEQRSTRCRVSGNTIGSSAASSGGYPPPCECSRTDQERECVTATRTTRGTRPQDFGVDLAATESDSSACYGSRPAPRQPQQWSVLAVLHGQTPRTVEPSIGPASLACGSGRGSCDRSIQDWTLDCRCDRGSCDGRCRTNPAFARECIPSQGGAEEPVLQRCILGDQGCTQERSLRETFAFHHPYTKAIQHASVGVRLASVDMVPVGDMEVYDLTVESASHYVSFGGIVSKNCGFDELTQFPDRQYRYLFSRLRRLKGSEIPIRMRAGSNPGGLGHAWVFDRFIKDPNTASRVFVPSTLDDNPYLDKEEYELSLNELDPVERERLRHGNWYVQRDGLVFPGLEDCFVAPRALPVGELYGGIDWGWHNPFCCLSAVLDHDDVLWIHWERHKSYATLTDHAQAIKDIQSDGRYFGDPAGADQIAELRRNGIDVVPCVHKGQQPLIASIDRVNRRIRTGRLKVFTTCKETRREAGIYHYDPAKAKDIPVDADNHAMSALRYLITGIDRNVAPEHIPKPADPEAEAAELAAAQADWDRVDNEAYWQ